MEHVLAGDIGGTKTELGLFVRDAAGLREVAVARYPSGEYAGLAPMLRDFLRAHVGAEVLPTLRAAAFGVAGPVHEGVVRTTNLPWVVDAHHLSEALGCVTGLINDFHAVALGVVELGPEDVHVLQAAEVDPHGPVAVIGAGTGLGEAILVPTRDGPRVLSSEGGHTDFAPRSDIEIELLRFLWKRHSRVSVERVVSGLGIRTLYEFVTSAGLAPESPSVRAELAQGDPGAVIGRHALARSDAACVRAIDLFVSAYGAEAGNLALKTLPSGGVYITGGIAPKLLDVLREGSFMRAFLTKGRMSPLLERIRVSVVMHPRAALLGARRHALSLMP